MEIGENESATFLAVGAIVIRGFKNKNVIEAIGSE
jgi:hypothetical protein